MYSIIFKEGVVAIESIDRNSRASILFCEKKAKKPLLNYYKMMSLPIKGGGKMILYCT